MRSAAQRVGKKSTHVLRGGYAEGLQRRFVSHSRGCLFWELANSRSGLWSWVGAPRIQKRTRSLRGASYVGQLGGFRGSLERRLLRTKDSASFAPSAFSVVDFVRVVPFRRSLPFLGFPRCLRLFLFPLFVRLIRLIRLLRFLPFFFWRAVCFLFRSTQEADSGTYS